MQNKYPGTCTDCGQHVAAGRGKAFKTGGRWKVSHNGSCNGQEPSERSFKQIHGRCEDAPCCGCCGGGNDYMSAEDFHSGGYGDY